MRHRIALLLGALAIVSGISRAAPPEDFKIHARFFGAGDEPISRFEIVSYKGKVYQLPDETDEFMVYDPADRSCSLVDRRRGIFAKIPPDRLDSSMATLRNKLRETVARKEKSKDRGERIEARIYRDLVDPGFAVAFDPASGRWKMDNSSVRVEAEGIADADPGRLGLLREATDALVKLGSLRDSDAIPPFTRLDALDALFARKLRPVETTFVYRLTGPPIKYRWTYEPPAKLSDNDQIALTRVEQSRVRLKQVAFAEYEKD